MQCVALDQSENVHRTVPCSPLGQQLLAASLPGMPRRIADMTPDLEHLCFAPVLLRPHGAASSCDSVLLTCKHAVAILEALRGPRRSLRLV